MEKHLAQVWNERMKFGDISIFQRIFIRDGLQQCLQICLWVSFKKKKASTLGNCVAAVSQKHVMRCRPNSDYNVQTDENNYVWFRKMYMAVSLDLKG